jgi:hypothetical protein
MTPFVKFCRVARRPADIFAYLMMMVCFFSSGRLKLFLYQWRWAIVPLLLFGLVIYIVDSRSRKNLSKELAHVR